MKIMKQDKIERLINQINFRKDISKLSIDGYKHEFENDYDYIINLIELYSEEF